MKAGVGADTISYNTVIRGRVAESPVPSLRLWFWLLPHGNSHGNRELGPHLGGQAGWK